MCKYGDIYYADLPVITGSSVQQGRRPVLIVSNDKFNQHSTMVSIAPMTSKLGKNSIPTHVHISGYGLAKESIILFEQTMVLDQSRLLGKIGSIKDQPMLEKIAQALKIQFNMSA